MSIGCRNLFEVLLTPYTVWCCSILNTGTLWSVKCEDTVGENVFQSESTSFQPDIIPGPPGSKKSVWSGIRNIYPAFSTRFHPSKNKTEHLLNTPCSTSNKTKRLKLLSCNVFNGLGWSIWRWLWSWSCSLCNFSLSNRTGWHPQVLGLTTQNLHSEALPSLECHLSRMWFCCYWASWWPQLSVGQVRNPTDTKEFLNLILGKHYPLRSQPHRARNWIAGSR